jgi:uncharacterized membrane protein YgdD (TMEM256/DUF423 family)
MHTTTKQFLIIGGILMTAAVQLGAWHAHGLEEILTPKKMNSWDSAVSMHSLHAIGLAVLGLAVTKVSSPGLIRVAGWLMVAGIFLFSGSIYLTALGAPSILGMAAPFGGISFMIAWLLVAWAAFRS